MSSTEKLYQSALSDALTYLRENHSPSERIFGKGITPSLKKKEHAPLPQKGSLPPRQVVAKPIIPQTVPKVVPIKKIENKPPAPPLPIKKAIPTPIDKPATSLLNTLKELAPHLLTDEPIPDDTEAKKIASKWKEQSLAAEVTLLSFFPGTIAHRFLENVAMAITARLRPAKVAIAASIEKENAWDLFLSTTSLKFLACFPIPFERFPNLRSFYRENPAAGDAFLHTTPLIPLLPISKYLENPELKKELWKQLCTTLATPASS